MGCGFCSGSGYSFCLGRHSLLDLSVSVIGFVFLLLTVVRWSDVVNATPNAARQIACENGSVMVFEMP